MEQEIEKEGLEVTSTAEGEEEDTALADIEGSFYSSVSLSLSENSLWILLRRRRRRSWSK